MKAIQSCVRGLPRMGSRLGELMLAVILGLGLSLAAEAPVIESVRLMTGLTIRGDVGTTNEVLCADELGAGQWRVLTNVVMTSNPCEVLDQDAPRTHRFYQLAGKKEAIDLRLASRLTIKGLVGTTNWILYADESRPGEWKVLTDVVVVSSPYEIVDPGASRFQRYYLVVAQPPPAGMVFIPAGAFEMGDTFREGDSDQLRVHTVHVSAFYMDRYEVTKALWDEVYMWATNHGYSFDNRGSGKGAGHPVHTVYWWDVVKWCNARSEKEGRAPAYYTSAARTTVYRAGQVDVGNDWVKWEAGYRLPTEAEWEKAARGGLSGKRFPWGDTISHSQANYDSSSLCFYDVSPTRGCHPDYDTGGEPYTSPVGSFAPNGYGLHDMTGNVWEWCWDWYASSYYGTSPSSDPRGASAGSYRVFRGGGWDIGAWGCRVSYRYYFTPDYRYYDFGFRSVLPPGQP